MHTTTFLFIYKHVRNEHCRNMQNELTANSNNFPSLSYTFLLARSRSLAKWVISICWNKYTDKSSLYNHSITTEIVLNIQNSLYLFTHSSVILQTNSRSHKHPRIADLCSSLCSVLKKNNMFISRYPKKNGSLQLRSTIVWVLWK